MWQPETSVPVLSVPWAHVVSTAAEVHAAGRAVIAVAAFRLTGGRELRLAFRNRFGGISLMGRDRVDDVLQDFAEIGQADGPRRSLTRPVSDRLAVILQHRPVSRSGRARASARRFGGVRRVLRPPRW